MVYKVEPHPDERMVRTFRRTVLAVLLTALVISLWGTTPVMAQGGNDEVTLTIVARVVDSQGEPVYDAKVAVLLNGQTEVAAHGTSQSDGTFVVDLPLPEGDTTVTALAVKVARPHFEPLEWQAGADDVARLNASESVRLPDLELARRLTPGFWIATLTFVAILVLIALEKLHNTMAALLGVAVVLGTSFVGGAITPDLFIFDFERALEYVDFDVIFLVMGMMIVVGVIEETGIFQWLAYQAYRLSHGRAWLLVTILAGRQFQFRQHLPCPARFADR